MELCNFIENRPIIFTLILAALQWLVVECLYNRYAPEDKGTDPHYLFKKSEFRIKWKLISSFIGAAILCSIYQQVGESTADIYLNLCISLFFIEEAIRHNLKSKVNKNENNLSTLHLCLYLRESLHTYGYDTKQEPNDAILIHGTFILEGLLENRGIFTRPKLAFRLDLPHNLLCVSEELRIALSKVSEDYVTAALYDMNDLPQEVLELIAESSEKAIKCIKPLLKSQKT